MLRLTEPRRTAGLRPAAASPTQALSAKSMRLENPCVLRLTEPRPDCDFVHSPAPGPRPRKTSLDTPSPSRKIMGIQPEGKGILPEPRSIEKVITCQFNL